MRTLGKVHALSVANTAHTAVTVGTEVNEQCCTSTFLNTGTTVIALTLSKDATAPASVLPTDGTPGPVTIILPASMIMPLLWNTPQTPYSVSAIGSAAGPGIVYITPVQV